MLNCHVCGRAYKTSHGLRKHVGTHGEANNSSAFTVPPMVIVCSKSAFKNWKLSKPFLILNYFTANTFVTECETNESEEFTVTEDDESPAPSGLVESYRFEEDDEAEEHLRNLQLEGDAADSK